jgi:type IV pili sensor histidine kinase/response regulator
MALRQSFFSVICLFVVVAGASVSAQVLAQVANPAMSLVGDGSQVVVGRYSTRAAQPEPGVAEPLDVVVQLSFPRQQVATIGDAVRYTLLRTGFTLIDAASLGPQAERFLQLPLPESQRELGPYRVQAVLDVLLGPAWTWHHDPLERRVWFTVAPAYAQAAEPSQPTRSSFNAVATPVESAVVVDSISPSQQEH